MIDGMKPCPFCGNTKLEYGEAYYCVLCPNCKATGPAKDFVVPSTDAVPAWNTRATSTSAV